MVSFIKTLTESKNRLHEHHTHAGGSFYSLPNSQFTDTFKMSARAVIDAKAQHPEIALSMLIPYHPAERPVELPPGFDNTFYPPDMEKVPRRLAIVRANRYVVEHVDYLIAYVWHPGSNARDLLEYARKREQHNLITVTVLGVKPIRE